MPALRRFSRGTLPSTLLTRGLAGRRRIPRGLWKKSANTGLPRCAIEQSNTTDGFIVMIIIIDRIIAAPCTRNTRKRARWPGGVGYAPRVYGHLGVRVRLPRYNNTTHSAEAAPQPLGRAASSTSPRRSDLSSGARARSK